MPGDLAMLTVEELGDLWLFDHVTHETRKLAVPDGYSSIDWQQEAFERAINTDLMRLIDVTYVLAAMPNRLMKIFKLTEKGEARYKLLLEKRS